MPILMILLFLLAVIILFFKFINLILALVIGVGLIALVVGLRKRDKPLIQAGACITLCALVVRGLTALLG